MTSWQWECFERYTHSGVFRVTDAGPLLSPISTFKITRNCQLGLVLETMVVGEPQISNSPIHPNGTVRLTTETVEFAGNAGIQCTAHGVLPFSRGETHNADLVMETAQKAQVHSLTAHLRKDIPPTYVIDWLGNLHHGRYVWNGSPISEKRETVDTLTLGHGAGAVELSSRDLSFPRTNFSTLELVIDGVRLFISDCLPEIANGIKRPGYIFYVGNPPDETRTKIRQVLSFCLGNYLIYLGSTGLNENSEIVSFSAMSPPSIGRISEIQVLSPGFLGTGNALLADQGIVSRMANAVYAHYDELRFNSFSWAYWHALCAPVHMAAGHFGAAIEALQRAYLDSRLGKIERNLVTDKEKWNALTAPFLQAIDGAELDPSVVDILKNRVKSNLNQKPADKISEAFLAAIGITLGAAESAAWKRRHQAAHGTEVDLDSAIPTIRETKLLKIILHRIILKITGASDLYYDDYTIGHPIRNVTEPVP